MAFMATVLVLLAAGVHVDSQTLDSYIPHITNRDLEGKVTTSTFVLEQPRCNFTDVGEDEWIWLLVARSSAAEGIPLPKVPKNLPYQSFSTNSAYMTLETAAVNYPCATSPDEITILRVGTETSCIKDASTPNCNGPLPDPGPYKVRFIVIRPDNTTKSNWSDDIILIQGRDYTTINTSPRRGNKGMIALTSILSVLMAILLASFIAILIYKCSDNCGNADIASIRDAATVTRYSTHHMYNHPTSSS
ncbi:PREDICTED: uroplakin-3b-like protein [Gekko japonicus]|uniref:Uroplakin-3b-like protein n=1 Tax=Gekko japonicus TaxID=146911 RepID=A0ABM1JPY1_GEKJA|nr:PREDICTED: uroplakin-3b-like protein [Gekko japonicus]